MGPKEEASAPLPGAAGDWKSAASRYRGFDAVAWADRPDGRLEKEAPTGPQLAAGARRILRAMAHTTSMRAAPRA
jgi:hypothetical protein